MSLLLPPAATSVCFALRLAAPPLAAEAVELGAVRLAVGDGAGVVRAGSPTVRAEDVLQLPAKLLGQFTLGKSCLCN